MGRRNKGMHVNYGAFKDLLQAIEKAEGNVDIAAKRLTREAMHISFDELTNAVQKAQVPDRIKKKIDKRMEAKSGRYAYQVGWRMGNYNPKNPNDSYLAVFLNYGTVRRETKDGKDRGKLEAKNFILKAKKAQKKRIEKLVKDTYDDIINNVRRGLK